MEKGSDISLLVALLPQYRLLNTLYQQIVDGFVLGFDVRCNITDFYNEFNDKQAFEKAIVNMLLSVDKDNQKHVFPSSSMPSVIFPI
jgi:hypothetical protein